MYIYKINLIYMLYCGVFTKRRRNVKGVTCGRSEAALEHVVEYKCSISVYILLLPVGPAQTLSERDIALRLNS